ncbi:acyl carrier protein [Mucilaginibacter flavidus]|uniref:acyl carrier protein n=1 Tax=Mucilaginibacter flavidus TaxID=2949309 RepID=UPI0020934646|nr:acyl carrier protein [Mucilaginibacter flavidus]MCO5946692.1 acyl carrier protein [Mucilaginibacter flavidus]
MDRNEILNTVNNVFIDVLDDDSLVLTEATTANDVEEWDSLNHIQLVVAIERQFKIRFASQEILSWQNVGEMIDSIAAKLNQ